MKKGVLILLFSLLIVVNSYAQNKEFTIAGKVDSYPNHWVIKNAKLRLVFSDSTVVKVDVDSTGCYSYKKKINRNTGCVIECYVPLADPIGVCPYSFKNSLQFDHERISFTMYLDSTSAIIRKDFPLSEMNVDYILTRSIYFQKNSLSYLNELIEYCSGDTAIDCAIDFLQVHPKYNLTIYGYCDKKEKNKEQLSTNRAKIIYDKFIKRGLDPNLISYKGFPKSATRLVEYDNVCDSRVELQFGFK
jgi:outer membrane protein OmpA-like peptidoglycan-associated protein